jgi:uncharacterized protein YkwD
MTRRSYTDMMSIRFSALRRGAVLALAAGALSSAVPAMGAVTTAQRAGQAELLVELNAARERHGLAPLTLSRILNRPARAHSAYLARVGKLTHTGQDGKPFYVRLYRAGYSRRKAVAENLGMAGGCSTDLSKTMVEMWLDSPGHRRNLLSPRYSKVGIALVEASDCSNTIYTTDFGG